MTTQNLTSPRPRPTSPQTAGATSEIDLAPAPHIFDWGEVELAPTAHHKNHHDLAPGARSPQTDLTTPGATPMTFPHPDLTGTTSSTTNNTVAMGRGDDLDVAAGRCCPTCRHNLTDHNRQVWNAGYTIAQRHAKDDIANAWEEGFSAACDQHIAQRRDPSHPITRDNPYAGGASS